MDLFKCKILSGTLLNLLHMVSNMYPPTIITLPLGTNTLHDICIIVVECVCVCVCVLGGGDVGFRSVIASHF